MILSLMAIRRFILPMQFQIFPVYLFLLNDSLSTQCELTVIEWMMTHFFLQLRLYKIALFSYYVGRFFAKHVHKKTLYSKQEQK